MEEHVVDFRFEVVGRNFERVGEVVLAARDLIVIINKNIEIFITAIKTNFNIMEKEKVIVVIGIEIAVDETLVVYTD